MKTIVTISVLAVTMLVLGGCGSGQQEEVGFLSDYSKLMKFDPEVCQSEKSGQLFGDYCRSG
ncbi:MAG: hypothetical protein ACYTER_11215 [Planctomycetota bacterium]|jgi:hypothetical protein